MSIYKVLNAGHSLVPGDLLFGGEYFGASEGMQQLRFKVYDEIGGDKGFRFLPIAWLAQNVRLEIHEPQRNRGIREEEFIDILAGRRAVPLPPTQQQAPDFARLAKEKTERSAQAKTGADRVVCSKCGQVYEAVGVGTTMLLSRLRQGRVDNQCECRATFKTQYAKRTVVHVQKNEYAELVSVVAFPPHPGVIPKKLHFIWLGSSLPPKYLGYIVAFMKMNLDYEINLWSNDPAVLTKAILFDASRAQPIRPPLDRSVDALLDPPLPSRRAIERKQDALFQSEEERTNLALERYTSILTGENQQAFQELFAFTGRGIRFRNINELNMDSFGNCASIIARESNGPGLNYGAASDMLRLVILYQEGGIYLDTDTICLRPFGTLEVERGALFGLLQSNIINAVMGCIAGLPAMRMFIQLAVTRYDDKDSREAAWVTKRLKTLSDRRDITLLFSGPGIIGDLLRYLGLMPGNRLLPVLTFPEDSVRILSDKNWLLG